MQCSSCQTEVDASQRFCPKCGALVTAEAAAPDPLLGQTIGGKYKIVRMLGEGGMGCVYEAEQLLGTKTRRIAIKTLHTHLSKDPKVIARFQREVGTIAELEHPNTIQVYDFGSTAEGQLFIAMEFVQGRNLADILEKEGPMAPDRAQGIFEQIAGSLAEAHQRGIVHRDLKPDNIVLTERAGKKDFVKVLDFGIAKRGGEEDKNEPKLTQAGMVLGTPPYMSPEQFTGKPIDARSDIYSLGIVVYEMLCGKLPFKADTAWEWASQHMTVQPVAIETTPEGAHLPERMRSAIARALAKSPDDRWSTVQAFYDAFASGTGGAPQVGAPGLAPKGGTAVLGGVPGLAGTGAGVGAVTPAPFGAADSGGAPRARTEIGAPVDLSAFGAGPVSPYAGPPSPMGAAAGGYGPPPAIATPAYGVGGGAIPAPPPRGAAASGGGGNKGLLLGIAGLLAVGAAVLIFFATKGQGGSKSVDLGAGGGPATTTPAAQDTSAPAPDPAGSSTGDQSLAPLASGKPAPTHLQGGPAPGPHPTAPPTAPTTPPAPTPEPTPPPAPTPTTPPKPQGNPPACAAAGTMKALGRMKEYNNLAAICRAGGGTPP